MLRSIIVVTEEPPLEDSCELRFSDFGTLCEWYGKNVLFGAASSMLPPLAMLGEVGTRGLSLGSSLLQPLAVDCDVGERWRVMGPPLQSIWSSDRETLSEAAISEGGGSAARLASRCERCPSAVGHNAKRKVA
mmetsp:Transcript_93152/g.301170  ORF Transcript_93152/g.301170 Transcript_93152/m.301170 type:complete len:133 (-) Transcript_93152:3-401(-)